jgi:hypothetical protein
MKCAIEMASCGMLFLPSFMKSDTGFQAILRFHLRNLRGYIVGITEEKKLCSAPLRWAQMA